MSDVNMKIKNEKQMVKIKTYDLLRKRKASKRKINVLRATDSNYRNELTNTALKLQKLL